ncbi:hpcH/HpaI aldolase family domain protein [Burkholderia thailandensis]|uniref:HpcH/HpaI aldolase family domain protein n=1 Tax=Burkholderia thailandensis TaxID=57975 RepID=A0AAW9CWY0_BURTH|nr:hpcH/HpaI aldolase family domain protein [Burkholderia thailandensis]MDW9254391.1 hpcH/HpaI aldolase family domain protein [Burkholderia thailandensis]
MPGAARPGIGVFRIRARARSRYDRIANRESPAATNAPRACLLRRGTRTAALPPLFPNRSPPVRRTTGGRR